MYVLSHAGLQIDEENLYSKLPFLTTTYLIISTLLDILGESGNFFALWTLCISERKKIEAAVFLFSVLPKFQFHVECPSESIVYRTWQRPKRARSIECLLIRYGSEVSSLQPLQFIISWSKYDHFTMHPLKDHSTITLKKLIAPSKTKFGHQNHSKMCLLL